MTFTQTRWSLADLYPGFNTPELESAFDRIEEQVASFEGLRSNLAPDMPADRFLDILRASEEMTREAHQLYAFAGLSFAADTQDQAAQSLQARVQQFLADMENRALFFSLWWKDLDEGYAKRLMDASGDYRYYLEEMRHFKPHTLSEPEEKVINLKNVTGPEALNTLYSTITSRYVFRLQVNGETKELTRGQLMAYVQGPDPELRAAGYQELYRVFGTDGLILGQMYQTRVRDWRNENLTLRKFSSPMAVRNLSNDIPDKAVDTLLDVARKNAGIFQRYFKMKARVLGMEKLRRYDIYAPVAKAEKPFEYASAAQMVLDSFSEFDPKVGELARRVFDQDHMDSEVRKGKRDGAF
jgi:oligoendopeptidase F